MQKINILYVGPLQYGSTSLQRMQAIKELGFNVNNLDTKKRLDNFFLTKLFFYILENFFFIKDPHRLNKKILNIIKKNNIEILWIDKVLFIKNTTLLKIKIINSNIILIFFSPDDMLNPNNQSKHYLQCLPLFDYHITTKSFHLKELSSMGAKNVVMMNNAYCPHVHRPIQLSDSEKSKIGGEVGFIGFWEKEREEYIEYLAKNNILVRVWGPWPKNRKYHNNIKVEGNLVLGDDYAKTICSFDINLCFLRKINRDLQTTRSIEIPACGAFMLAERSIEHQSLFDEGVEADYFDSKEELLKKVNYYLENKVVREKIAKSGFIKCLSSGYSYKERLEPIINNILNENL